MLDQFVNSPPAIKRSIIGDYKKPYATNPKDAQNNECRIF
jgi:hypothetical protein